MVWWLSLTTVYGVSALLFQAAGSLPLFGDVYLVSYRRDKDDDTAQLFSSQFIGQKSDETIHKGKRLAAAKTRV
jgi:hypothetical protein